MNHQSNSPTPDTGAINDLARAAVRSHRIKLRALTTAASVLGFVAIATSTFFVCSYFLFYMPRQRAIFDDLQRTAEQANTYSTEAGVKRMHHFMVSQVWLTYCLSMGVIVVALAVAVLGLGTLILLTVVILNRRVALNQINASLAQISNQLQGLHTERAGI